MNCVANCKYTPSVVNSSFWSDMSQEKSSKTWTASQGNLHYHEYDALDAQGCSIVQESVSKSYNSGLLHQESICKFGYGIRPDVSCLGFESTSVLYLYMSPKKTKKLWMIVLENAPLSDMDLETFTGSWPRKQVRSSLVWRNSSLIRQCKEQGWTALYVRWRWRCREERRKRSYWRR